MNARIKIFDSIEELNEFALAEIVRIGSAAIQKRGVFTLALSGGSTPKKLYALLAKDNQLNWHQTHFFFGDERHVSPDSEESNFRTANETLFSKIDVPPQSIHRFYTEEENARVVAEKMENDLREFFKLEKGEFPRFDLILLGMGADGHTASLFPETPALNETKRLVVENYVEKFKTYRLTFTVPAINHARNIIFLVAGEDKTEAVREVLKGERNTEKFPARLIHPIDGNLEFLLDEKAAEHIK